MSFIARLGWLCCFCLSATAPTYAVTLGDVTASLVQDIQQAERKLSQETGEIARQSTRLARQIDEASQGLERLRDRAAVIRRQADERTVTLSALEERIQAWRNQDNYRANLLADFAQRQTTVTLLQGRELSASADIAVADTALDQIEAALAPAFKPGTTLNESGEVVAVDILKLGPIRWFHDRDSSGLLFLERNNLLRVGHRFDAATLDNIATLRAAGSAPLLFDPSVDRLLRTRVAPPTMIEHLAKGGVWIVPIFAFALLATVIAIGKSVQFARLPKLQPILPSAQTAGPGFMDQLQGAQREVVRVAQAAASSEQRDDMLFSLLLGERAKLERFLGAIAVTATVSPLLGLLGTVSGMITTFNMMTLFGAGDPAVVSGGISEALVTTELGLIVAIPALILHALLSRKATAYAEGLEASAIALTQQQAVVTVVPSS